MENETLSFIIFVMAFIAGFIALLASTSNLEKFEKVFFAGLLAMGGSLVFLFASLLLLGKFNPAGFVAGGAGISIIVVAAYLFICERGTGEQEEIEVREDGNENDSKLV